MLTRTRTRVKQRSASGNSSKASSSSSSARAPRRRRKTRLSGRQVVEIRGSCSRMKRNAKDFKRLNKEALKLENTMRSQLRKIKRNIKDCSDTGAGCYKLKNALMNHSKAKNKHDRLVDRAMGALRLAKTNAQGCVNIPTDRVPSPPTLRDFGQYSGSGRQRTLQKEDRAIARTLRTLGISSGSPQPESSDFETRFANLGIRPMSAGSLMPPPASRSRSRTRARSRSNKRRQPSGSVKRHRSTRTKRRRSRRRSRRKTRSKSRTKTRTKTNNIFNEDLYIQQQDMIDYWKNETTRATELALAERRQKEQFCMQ